VFDRELTDLFVIQEDIARGIADTLKVNLTSKAEQKQLVRCVTTVEAYDLYLKGLYHFHRRLPADISKSIAFLEQAIAADPNYAPAHAAKAEAYGLLWFSGQANREKVVPVALGALATALRLEPNLPEALALSAFVLVLRNWDWVGAGLAFERALELDDRSPSLHWKHAMWFLAPTGRMSEALAEIEWAVTLDPLSALVIYMKALILWCDRQHRMAELACERALMIDPDFGLSRVLLGCIYQQTGRHAQAITAFEETLSSSGSDSRTLSRLAAVYAETGRRDDALRILADLRQSSTDLPVWTLGWIHLSLGDHAEAYRQLEIGVEMHDPNMVWLKVHPDFDRLRTHPQFGTLLRRVGLGC
jgi:tetratricopeptide (TPR) repeat protein